MAALGFRVGLLFTSQRHADPDEAVVGMMARHIMERGERPLYFYGQDYGGGGALEAYLATIPFAVFGVSSISLKLVPMAVYLALVAATFAFCLRYFGPRVAVLAGFLVAFAVPGIQVGLKARGGHLESALLSLVLAHLLFRILGGEKPRRFHVALFGVVAGFAVWCYEASILFVLSCALFALASRKAFSLRRLSVFLVAFLVGWGPALYSNLTKNFANLRWMFSFGGGAEQAASQAIWHRLWATLSVSFPRFFGPHNMDGLVPQVPAHAWIQYGILVAAGSYLVVRYRRLIGRFARGLLPWGRCPLEIEGPEGPVFLLLLYLVSILLAYAWIGRVNETARYFMPILPAVFVLIAVCLVDAWDRWKTLGRIVVVACGSFLVSLGPAANAFAIEDGRVVIMVILARDQLCDRFLSGETVPAVARFLERVNARYAVSCYGVQWVLTFESNEQTIASSLFVVPGEVRYPEYDEAVWRNPERGAWVFHSASVSRQRLEGILRRNNVTYKRAQVGELYVYYDAEGGWGSVWKPGILMTSPGSG